MKRTTLVIQDQVNVKFMGLDPHTRRKLVETLKVFIPQAQHMPSFKLGRWDGKASFATVGGSTYINLLDRALPVIMDAGYEVDIDDRRPKVNFTFPEVTETMFAGRCWPQGHEKAGESILLRDYQVNGIKIYLDNLQSIQSIATGAGKTILTSALSALVEPYGRSLVIVPSKQLVTQTEEDYINLGLNVGVYFGDRKEWNRTHTIATWQSLAVFSKKTRRDEAEIPLDDFLDGIVCVMCDECHLSKAAEIRDLLCGPLAHVPIRFGLTGTIPKEEHEFLCLLSAIGPVVGEIKASELQKKGVLANCDVDIVQLKDDHIAFNDYHQEYDYLVNDKIRMKWVAEYCEALGQTGNTLVLVDRIRTGEFLAKNIPDSVFISGSMKVKNRKKEYDEVKTASSKIIIGTFGVASLGINIPRIFNLVLLESGKSFTRVIQSLGRSLRRADDKDHAHIVDICSTLKYSSRHVSKRRSFYKEASYPATTRKIDYRTTDVISVLSRDSTKDGV